MDPHSLRGASTYLNNLLLARGLLRNGKSIEFAHPSKGEGGKEATMAQIINLVHDLILRRDREQEQRESMMQTLRDVRVDNQRANSALERLQTGNDDLKRQLSLAQSSERSAKNAVRAAERSERSLREEMGRLKTTVQQVRASCANDVRKRDLQIQRLKAHLLAQQRGNKTGLVGASITITPGQTGANSASREEEPANLEDPEYSLKQETTEFLTQLSQSLSDENDNLIGLVRSTLATLRELQGMPELGQHDHEAGPHGEGEDADSGLMHALPTSYDALATDMDHVLDHLRGLLTNPNFVSIHEVESREEEIIRLREGWEKMQQRWREAVSLMQGWRRRMMDGGDTITLDELQLGLVSGEGLAPVAEEDEEGHEMESDDEYAEEDEEIDEPPIPSPGKPTPEDKTDLFDIKLRPTSYALHESDGNKKSPRKVVFAPSNNNTPHSQNPDENAPDVDMMSQPTSKPSSTNQKTVSASRLPTSTGSYPSSTLRSKPSTIGRETSGIPRSTRKKRKSSEMPPSDEEDYDNLSSPSKLTVQEKLAIAAREAEEAASTAAAGAAAKTAKEEEEEEKAAKAKLKTQADGGNSAGNNSSGSTSAAGVAKKTPKKTGVKGRARRRKSTLSPEELEALMGLND
ncbi:Afadin and alpha-actinin-binding-domain-containing protein [Phyllosticta citrichinensis]|uniref:Afadin and alpha-actinin-binding-domain-containing protein n=1 Tax=Phyllosticta citrichinensis TaxID=1130410 RepID=A0ABR1XH25_9PEZI